MYAPPQVAYMNDCFFIQEETWHFMTKKPSIHFIRIPIFTWMDKALQESRRNPRDILIIKGLLYQRKGFAYWESTKFISIKIFKRQFIS